jgi:hypothetical protein
MPTAFTIEHDGRRIELVPESSWKQDLVLLLVDGRQVAEAKPDGANTVVEGEGLVVRAVMPWHGASIKRAELVPAGGEPLAMQPAPGSAAARRARLERERPGLYAARHVAKGVGQALLAVVGVAFLVRFLPELPLPSIDLPELPAIDLPGLPVPSIEPPGWVEDVLRTKQYWLPVLLGIALALNEWRRRRARGRAEPARDSERNVDG